MDGRSVPRGHPEMALQDVGPKVDDLFYGTDPRLWKKDKKGHGHTPSVPFTRLDELSGGIIIRYVEPEAVRNGG